MNEERAHPHLLRTPVAEQLAGEEEALNAALQDAASEIAESLRRDELLLRKRRFSNTWVPLALGALVLTVVAYSFLRESRVASSPNKKGFPIAIPHSSSGVELHTGDFTLRFPRGFKWDVRLLKLEDNFFQLSSKRNLNCEGVYVLRGQRLVMEQPTDRRLTEFQWLVIDSDHLELVEEPPAAKTGAKYLGATLERIAETKL